MRVGVVCVQGLLTDAAESELGRSFAELSCFESNFMVVASQEI